MTALLVIAPALARANLDIYQCENGYTGRASCVVPSQGSSRWVTGNITHSNYRQGNFVPFRAVLSSQGSPSFERGHTYVMRIGYDAVVDGLHAYDYLGTYDDSAREGQVIDPCSGVTNTEVNSCSGSGDLKERASTTVVPKDPFTTFPDGRSQPDDHHFYAWGVTLLSATYPAPQPPIDSIDSTTTGTVRRFIDLTFRTPMNGTGNFQAVIAWGGHIAHADDWGPSNTYALSGLSGSNVHLALADSRSDASPAPPSGATGFQPGHQELPLTVIQRPNFTTGVTIQNPGPGPEPAPGTVHLGGSVTDTARLSGKTTVGGTVTFVVCSNPTQPPNCPNPDGDLVGHDEPVTENGTSAIAFEPDAAGFYCFRAEYEPGGLDDPFLPASHTNTMLLTTNTSTTAECFQVTPGPTPPGGQSTLTVKKVCVPETDGGQFDITIDGATAAGGSVRCGGTIGPIPVTPGGHTVAERGAGGTNLGGYEQVIGGDCDPGGHVDIGQGEHATCEISNVRHSEESRVGELTLLKFCAPPSDGGLFNLRINDVTALDENCGGRVGPLALLPGTHHVGETAGTGTNSSDYTRVIGGACHADGSIRVTAGRSATCTITNVRRGTPTAVLTVRKRCRPANDRGRFMLDVDEESFPRMRCGQSTGPITIATGMHLVGEVAVPRSIGRDYVIRFGGDCAATGTITLEAHQHATCTVTNTRISRVNAAQRRAQRPRPRRPPRPNFTG